MRRGESEIFHGETGNDRYLRPISRKPGAGEYRRVPQVSFREGLAPFLCIRTAQNPVMTAKLVAVNYARSRDGLWGCVRAMEGWICILMGEFLCVWTLWLIGMMRILKFSIGMLEKADLFDGYEDRIVICGFTRIRSVFV